MSDDETTKTRLVARLPISTVKRTKIAAVEEDTTISEIVRRALEAWLNRQNHTERSEDKR